MTLLDRDLLRNELLGELHCADTQADDGQAGGDAQHRGVEGVPPEAVLLEVLVLPGPEEVDRDEGQAEHDRQCPPETDTAGGTFLGGVALDGETLLAVGDGDIIELGADTGELLVAHALDLFFRVGDVVFTHDRVPIHIAAPMSTTIPAIHISMPSVTGPIPPRP